MHADPATFQKNWDLTPAQKEYTITECEKVVSALEKTKPDMSDLEKYFVLALWADQRVEYDWDFWYNGYNFDFYRHQWDAYGALYQSGQVGIYHTNLPIEEEGIETMADSFETTENRYDTEINGYMRGRTWQKALEYREQVTSMMEEHDIDAIMYIASFDVPPTCDNMDEGFVRNPMGYGYGLIFGPALGMPEVVIPMGFSDADKNVPTELPLGMRLLGKFGDEKNLMEMAYAYEQQAGDAIRRMPENSPALEDQKLSSYLEALMDAVYSIDYDLYTNKPTGRIELMKQAYLKAAQVDTSDPYATYKASARLAKAYDNVMKTLKASGLKKLTTSFKVKLSKKKIKARSAKKQTVKVKAVKLTKGSSKPVYSIKRVTNGQKTKVGINKSTGKVTVKKKIKKCKIVVQVSSKANSTHTGLTKSVTITVK